jgi:peptidyl-dipeptidase A
MIKRIRNCASGLSAALTLGAIVAMAGCDGGASDRAADDLAATGQPAVADVREFLERAEAELAAHWEYATRVNWVRANFITDDTNRLVADTAAQTSSLLSRLTGEARRFAGMDLPEDLARKLNFVRMLISLPAPGSDGAAAELGELRAWLESTYSTGQVMFRGRETGLGELEAIIDSSRDPDELAEAWSAWRKVAESMPGRYARLVDIANDGAREMGFANVADLWLAGYEMSGEQMQDEVQRLWSQVEPLYEELHCHVRDRLSDYYGEAVQGRDQPIRADLLGNMWAQQWLNIYDIVALSGGGGELALTELLQAHDFTPRRMTETAEAFFVSLGFEPLPDTFWERSLLTEPADRDVVCHPSAWSIDGGEDLRIKMCMSVTADDFQLIHHELGHNFYYRAYRDQDFLFREGAHDGFHEAIGDFIALSVTPEYLREIGLVDEVPPPEADLDLLLEQALDKVAFLPFALLLDQWRWQVFRGEVTPDRYNDAWWELRRRYQGVEPPVVRSSAAFDPGAKYHIPASVPYLRYFLAFIMQFQLHEAACRIAGWDGPLHRCSVYGNREVGERLKQMLALGRSVPWPDALEEFTGTREMDGGAILAYFEPLMARLQQENATRSCGW